MEKNVNLYTLSLSSGRAWLTSLVFVVAGIVLPQLCHLVPQGGLILLPIYFFTLIAAYKYGLWVGLVTAVTVPLANHLLFAMPPLMMLPVILAKGTALAIAAAFAARLSGRVSLIAIACAVAAYQVVFPSLQDLTLGFPGLALQIFGGWALLRALQRV